jgi:DNA-binding transcriptional MerR regulator
LNKEYFNIKDLAKIVKKETQTIRSWEAKGIIQKPQNRSDNGWREYSRNELATVLESILSYNWQRKVIKNEIEIQHIIDCLRGKIDESSFSLMNAENE